MSMFDRFTFRVVRHQESAATTFSVSAMDHMFAEFGPRTILPAMLEAVTKQLTDEWIARHGEQLLEDLAPDVVRESVEKSLRTKVAKAVFGDAK